MGQIWAAIVSVFIRLIPSFFRKKNKVEGNNNTKVGKKKDKKVKFKNITEEDVNNAIFELEQQRSLFQTEISNYVTKIKETNDLGRNEIDPEMQSYYAQNLVDLKNARTRTLKRMKYLSANIRVMQRLREAVKDNSFYSQNIQLPLNQLLSDQEKLFEYFKNSVANKIGAESIIVDSEKTFDEIEQLYEEPTEIYQPNKDAQAQIAQWEAERNANDQQVVFAENGEGQASKTEDTDKK